MFEEKRTKELKEQVATKAQNLCGCVGWKAVAITISDVTTKYRERGWRTPKSPLGVRLSYTVLTIRAQCSQCEAPSGPIFHFYCDEYAKVEDK